ncbi:Hsp70 family protein [Asanoa sp. WMMD1127]|uniref:Hsp70 family protein n=1 Tax=Asanoa sp. WMMD1127 TaxID=3016107 RepID=UPI0024168A96|nr:Hsp70 family protein [Asanoa sp. WMMD1127]MDG4822792.1 Hsp70 family protein [Asanoa sp. WMMD1127]
MTGDGVRVGIDYGTSHTVAVLAEPGREPRTVLFDGSPLLPSGVCADGTGRLLVGRDAWHTGLSTPAAFEPFPKQRIGDGVVLLGERELPVEELIAATLARVGQEAARIAGAPLASATVTYPAAWGAQRRQVLSAAAASVFPSVDLVAEPVAAANLFAGVAGQAVPVGRCAVVYDFGAGTFDVSVVRREPAGFAVLASEGRADCGGLDVDAAIVRRLGETVGRADAAVWERLANPASTGDRRASRQLWDNARSAKEMLSRAASTVLHVPLLEVEVTLGREELEELTEPIVAGTIEATRAALSSAGIASADLAAVYLTGGSSRMPAVGTALHRAFGVAPVLVEQPELVVAEGSVRSATVDPPAVPVATPVRPARRTRRVAVLSGLVVLVAAAAVAVVPLLGRGDGGGRKAVNAAVSFSPSVSARPSSSVTPSRSPSVDPCVLGRWRSTAKGQMMIKIDGVETAFKGGGGVVQTYTADGAAKLVYRNTTWAATVKGSKWTYKVNGTASAKVFHQGGYEYVAATTGDGEGVLYEDGRRDNSIKLDLVNGREKYFCTGNTLVFVNGGDTSEWVRQ